MISGSVYLPESERYTHLEAPSIKSIIRSLRRKKRKINISVPPPIHSPKTSSQPTLRALCMQAAISDIVNKTVGGCDHNNKLGRWGVQGWHMMTRQRYQEYHAIKTAKY